MATNRTNSTGPLMAVSPGISVTVMLVVLACSIATVRAPAEPLCAKAGSEQSQTCKKPELVEVKKIWDRVEHNAFTDLIRFQEKWFCTFREAERHVYGKDGEIRVIVSDDGSEWESAALLTEVGVDLRDPKLSITPDGRLMIVAGGSVYEQKKFITRQPRVAYSDDACNWTLPQRVLTEGEWLWRVTWHKGRAYGVSCNTTEKDWGLRLFTSTDAVNYDLVSFLPVPGRPNETTLRFLPDSELIACQE